MKSKINMEEPSLYGSILICKVACYSKYMEDMGIVNDVWMTCSIDLYDVCAIRNVELEEDENYNGLANIYVRGYRDWETDRKSTRLNSSHRL